MTQIGLTKGGDVRAKEVSYDDLIAIHGEPACPMMSAGREKRHGKIGSPYVDF